ncbi:hypothetical protein [Algoriphagus boritolerans]|uniref:hypothetical protein n=1 Tax=Algoriphagus boritolerans TaxID=308111 RepID=UPI000AB791D4
MTSFFDLYKIEHQWLSQKAGLDHWDLGILDAVDYLDFTQQHLQELIRLRFLKSDWPGDLGVLVNGISQYQLAEWLEAPSSDREKLLDSYFQSIQKSNQKGPLMEDFYLIKNGGDLSVGLIPTDRMEVYRNLEKKNLNAGKGTLNGQFADFLSIFGKLCKGLPSDEFFIDLVDLSVKRVD